MKMSQLFTKTLRDNPKNETARSAQLLIRAGFMHKQMAGVYAFLPLGLMVLEKIKQVIREEMNAIGGQEILMTALQNPEPWQATGRWDDKVFDVWFKTKLAAGGELGLGATHEEPITAMLRDYIASHKDLPLLVYQFQNKFRNELRAKSGILRTREFLMKDLYSFARDEEEHQRIYSEVEQAYKRIYRRLGIGDITYQTFASGGSFSKYSHEFQTVSPVGEDTVWHNADYSVVLNEEVLEVPGVLSDLGVKREELVSAPAAEVGNIFTLGVKYSEPLGLKYNGVDGVSRPVFMGCYGIGVSRVLGIIAETFADEKGLVWPKEVAPRQYYIVAIGEEAERRAEVIEKAFPGLVMYDDRKARPGEKFADAELMGIPCRVVMSEKTLARGEVEILERATGEGGVLTVEALTSKLAEVAKIA